MTANAVNFAQDLNAQPVRSPSTSSKERDSSADQGSQTRGESFSSVLRDSSVQGKAHESGRNGYSHSKESKAAKEKDSTDDTAVPVTAPQTQQKDSLPITAILGMPQPQVQTPVESDTDSKSEDPANTTDPIVGKSTSAIGFGSDLLQAKLGFTQRKTDDGSGADNALLLSQQTTSPLAYLELINAQQQQANSSTASSGTATGTADSELSGVTANGATEKGTQISLRADTLAFAMRLGNGQLSASPKVEKTVDAGAPQASDTIQSNFAAVSANVVEAASGSLLEENAHHHDESATDQIFLDPSLARTQETPDTTTTHTEQPTAPTNQVDPEPTAPTAEPVRNVHMQLVNENNLRVDVRLIDRGGELHVSVKSADAGLTQSLQDHMSDLTSRLDQQHVQSEVWMPKTAEASSADAGSTRDFSSDKNNGSYSGNSDGRRDGQQQQKPDWVDALEKYS